MQEQCPKCGGDEAYCWKCGEREAACQCDDEDRNIGDCEFCAEKVK